MSIRQSTHWPRLTDLRRNSKSLEYKLIDMVDDQVYNRFNCRIVYKTFPSNLVPHFLEIADILQAAVGEEDGKEQ